MKYIPRPLGITLRGFYKTAVVDAVGQEIWKQPEWRKNLILNNGMDALYTYYTSEVMQAAVAGTGGRFNKLTGSESSGSAIDGFFYLDPIGSGMQDLNTTTYGGWAGALDVGDVIQFADGTEVSVTGSVPGTVVSDYSASLSNPSLVVSSQSFTIWKTSQTGLQTEVKRAGYQVATSSYLSGYCGTTRIWQSASKVQYRTYDFSAEAAGTTSYTEVGVAWQGTPAQSATIFSRIRLPFEVTVSMNQRLRLYYTLVCNWSPTASVSTPNVSITGWPVAPSTTTNCSQSIQVFSSWTCGGYDISSNGVDNDSNGASALEIPSSGADCYIWGSGDGRPLTQITGTQYLDRTYLADKVGSTRAAYVPGSYTCYKYGTFSLNQLNTSSLLSFGVGSFIDGGFGDDKEPFYEAMGFAMVFEQSQSKFNTQTLTMQFKWTWGRVLSD